MSLVELIAAQKQRVIQLTNEVTSIVAHHSKVMGHKDEAEHGLQQMLKAAEAVEEVAEVSEEIVEASDGKAIDSSTQ